MARANYERRGAARARVSRTTSEQLIGHLIFPCTCSRQGRERGKRP